MLFQWIERWIEDALDGLFCEAVDLCAILYLDVGDFYEIAKDQPNEVLAVTRGLLLAGFGDAADWPCSGKASIRTGVALLDAELRQRRFEELEVICLRN